MLVRPLQPAPQGGSVPPTYLVDSELSRALLARALHPRGLHINAHTLLSGEETQGVLQPLRRRERHVIVRDYHRSTGEVLMGSTYST